MNRNKRAVCIRRFIGRATFLAMLIAAAFLAIALRSAAQTLGGSVVGQVTNGTANAQVPEGLAVTLHVFSGMESTETYTTTVAADRTFRFGSVAFDQGQTLVARTVHDGVTYVSQFVTPEPDQDETQVPMTIYEKTESPADIAVAQLHIFVDHMEDKLEVGQYCLISNTGDQAYIGRKHSESGERKTWSVSLPDGAGNLSFEGAELGGRFIPSDDGFGDTRPVLPGAASVEASFTYEIAYSEGLQLEQVFDVPVNAAVLVLPEGDLALQGAQLSPEESLDTQMGAAVSYMAGPLDSGEPLIFAVFSRASSRSAGQRADGSRGLVIGIAALAAAGGAVYWMWRSPTPPPMPRQARSQVEAIAALDRDYEAGLVPEKQYRRQRASLKRRLSDQLSGK